MTEKLYNDIGENIKEIRENVANAAIKADRKPEEVSIMAVTKTVEPELVNIAIEHGLTLLGESRAQEMNAKIHEYSPEAEVHFIGSLQSNKVRQIIDDVTMIQSLDRISLVKEIERRAKNSKKTMDVLIQVNIGKEESKSGITPEEVLEFAEKVQQYPHLNLRGLMAIPPICDEIKELEGYFAKMRQLLVDIQGKNRDNKNIDILSMGMSGDYETAIKHGATIVRIGTAIFGSRD